MADLELPKDSPKDTRAARAARSSTSSVEQAAAGALNGLKYSSEPPLVVAEIVDTQQKATAVAAEIKFKKGQWVWYHPKEQASVVCQVTEDCLGNEVAIKYHINGKMNTVALDLIEPMNEKHVNQILFGKKKSLAPENRPTELVGAKASAANTPNAGEKSSPLVEQERKEAANAEGNNEAINEKKAADVTTTPAAAVDSTTKSITDAPTAAATPAASAAIAAFVDSTTKPNCDAPTAATPTAATPATAATSPEKQYFYIDQKGKENGPYSLQAMVEWIQYFSESTMIKDCEDDEFMPLITFPPLANPLARFREHQHQYTEFAASFEGGRFTQSGNANGASPFLGGGFTQSGNANGASPFSGGGITKSEKTTGDLSPTLNNLNKVDDGKLDVKVKKPQVKRQVNTPSESMVQVKDAVVRKQFEAMAKKLATVQKMTSYKTKKQNANNAHFSPCLVTLDGINQRPDKLADVDRARDIPLRSVSIPKNMTIKDAADQLAETAKAMQDVAGWKRKRNRAFDLKIVQEDPSKLCETHYGKKQQKKKKVASNDEAGNDVEDVDEE